ncbi:MAG: hypothetical protein AMK70_04185 [Nitrospira bacterium SG8_35_1]|nr:MAG: hypothetical protein AMK70_04185 [Nitrospira bacterium SG8_35_1]
METQASSAVHSADQSVKIEEITKYHEAKERSQTTAQDDYKDKVSISAKARELNQHSEINEVVERV